MLSWDVKNFRHSPDGEDGSGGEIPPVTPPEVKTFTQDELNRIVAERLAKEKDKYSRERLELLKKVGVETDEDLLTVAEKAKLSDQYKNEVETMKSEKALNERKQAVLKAGIDDEFVDYVLTKIPVDEKFDENLKAFVDANPKYAKETFARINASLALDGQGGKKPEDMTDKEYVEWRRTHNVDGTPIKQRK